MSRRSAHSAAVAGSVVVGVATGFVTNMLTTSPGAPWWWAAGALVALFVVLELLVVRLVPVEVKSSDSAPNTTINAGPGANVIAGNAAQGDLNIRDNTFNANGRDGKS